MAHGIQILNSGGFVQIDETYKNYELVASGTAVTEQVISIPDRGVIPLIAIGGMTANQHAYLREATTTTFKVSGTANASFAYRVYAPSSSAATTQFGFRVYNSAGAVNFDSLARYLRVAYTNIFSTASFPYSVNVNTPSTTAQLTFSTGVANSFVLINATNSITGVVQQGVGSSVLTVVGYCLQSNGTLTVKDQAAFAVGVQANGRSTRQIAVTIGT